MAHETWLCMGLVLLGCGQGRAPEPVAENVEAVQKPAAAAPAPAPAVAAAPKADCGCHGEHAPDPQRENVDVSALDLARAPAKGRADAPVTMLVFCDFQCPYCKRADRTLAELEQTYGDDLRIVWKQLPLPMHESAQLYAKASFAAQEQGKFWPMHDLLLHSDGLEPSGIDGLAASLDLDLPRFRAAMGSAALTERLAREAEDAASVGAKGTPTFVINGRKIVGAQPIATFTAVIDEELAAVR